MEMSALESDKTLLEEHVPQKPGRKKRGDKNSTKGVIFVLSWDLNARLDHYVAERKRKEHRNVDRSEIAAQVLDEFLTKEGY